MSKPRWFKDADGRFHVAYELKLTNGFGVPVTVTSVTVRDARRRRTIERLSGDELTASNESHPGRPRAARYLPRRTPSTASRAGLNDGRRPLQISVRAK